MTGKERKLIIPSTTHTPNPSMWRKNGVKVSSSPPFLLKTTAVIGGGGGKSNSVALGESVN